MDQDTLILVADPVPQRVYEMSRVLQPEGYQVIGARSGDECLATAREIYPDLLLLDQALPGISGIDLARQVKRDPELEHIAVGLLVEDSAPALVRSRSLDSGADACLPRDLSPREFLSNVQALLRAKRQRDELWDSVQRWQDIFDAMTDPVYVVSNDHRIVHCNLAMSKFLGRSPAQIHGQHCFELIHGTNSPVEGCLFQRACQSHSRESLFIERRGGWLQVQVDPLFDRSQPQGRPIGSVHILTDATDLRRTELELEQAREEIEQQAEHHREALASMESTIQAEVVERWRAEEELEQIRIEMRGQIDEYASEVLHLQQRVAEELAANQHLERELADTRRVADLVPLLQAAHESAAHVTLAFDLQTGAVCYYSDPRGLLFPAGQAPQTRDEFLAALPSSDAARLQSLWSAASSSQALTPTPDAEAAGEGAESPHYEEHHVEFSTRAPDADMRRWTGTGRAIQTAEGWVWVGTLTDNTTRAREAEARYQAQTMDAVAQLARGVAHDLNELLTVILAQTDLGMAQTDRSYPVRQNLAAIQEAARRAAAWTGELMAVGCPPAGPAQPVDLDAMLRELCAELDLTCECDLGAGTQALVGAPGSCKQALRNILLRTRDALAEGDAIRVETTRVTLSADDAAQPGRDAARPGTFLRLTVAGTGRLLGDWLNAHAFEPRSLGDGSLGLALAYGLVRQNGGWIEAHSRGDDGGRLELYLPVFEEIPEDDPTRHPIEVMPRGRETLLLAEDQEEVLDLNLQVLEALGYRVLAARDGKEALDLFAANADGIDMAILDVVMPRMSGADAAQHMHARRDGLPVLLVTGYDPRTAQVKGHGFQPPVLHKPYTVDELGRKVREMLDQGSINRG